MNPLNKSEPELNLKACPFCGFDSPCLATYEQDGVNRFSNKYAIQCAYHFGGCGAEGPHYKIKEESIEAWNRRVSSSEAPTVKEEEVGKKQVMCPTCEILFSPGKQGNDTPFLGGKQEFKKEITHSPDCESSVIKHVICEGSRNHVIRYDSRGAHCSEPNCEFNAQTNGSSPSKYSSDFQPKSDCSSEATKGERTHIPEIDYQHDLESALAIANKKIEELRTLWRDEQRRVQELKEHIEELEDEIKIRGEI